MGYPIESQFNFFCFNKQSKITYWDTKKGDQPLNDSGLWKKEGRQEIKPGKFIALFFDYLIVYNDRNNKIRNKDKILKAKNRYAESFCTKLKAFNNFDSEILISSNISEVYEKETHCDSGYLTSSCMRPESDYGCRAYSEFYDNIDGLKVVYGMKENKLYFRALLWQCEEATFLDRIYGTDEVNDKLIQWAKDKGYAHRHFSGDTIFLGDSDLHLNINIPDSATSYLENNGSPYVDTLYYLSGNELRSNYGDNKLQDCDGNFNGRDCYACDCSCDPDDMREGEGEYYCEECWYERFFYCYHCGDTHDIDDRITCDDYDYCNSCTENLGIYYCDSCCEYHKICTEVEGQMYCETCLYDECFYCEHCSDWHRNVESNFVHVNGEETDICDNCLSDYSKCDECGEYFDEVNENNYCENCITVEA